MIGQAVTAGPSVCTTGVGTTTTFAIFIFFAFHIRRIEDFCDLFKNKTVQVEPGGNISVTLNETSIYVGVGLYRLNFY